MVDSDAEETPVKNAAPSKAAAPKPKIATKTQACLASGTYLSDGTFQCISVAPSVTFEATRPRGCLSKGTRLQTAGRSVCLTHCYMFSLGMFLPTPR